MVDDTRDTAFVIFAVIVGMAVGAGSAGSAAAGHSGRGVAAAVCWVGRHLAECTHARAGGREHALDSARARGPDLEGAITSILKQYLEDYRLAAVETAATKRFRWK